MAHVHVHVHDDKDAQVPNFHHPTEGFVEKRATQRPRMASEVRQSQSMTQWYIPLSMVPTVLREEDQDVEEPVPEVPSCCYQWWTRARS